MRHVPPFFGNELLDQQSGRSRRRRDRGRVAIPARSELVYTKTKAVIFRNFEKNLKCKFSSSKHFRLTLIVIYGFSFSPKRGGRTARSAEFRL